VSKVLRYSDGSYAFYCSRDNPYDCEHEFTVTITPGYYKCENCGLIERAQSLEAAYAHHEHDQEKQK
jgi:late competence protein required for DNA uptake (superfamily II DNA/RNA helicase)